MLSETFLNSTFFSLQLKSDNFVANYRNFMSSIHYLLICLPN